jgi:CelD/BcsL family acetyltransferase involved in cellulose biosynthesis
VTQQDPAVHVRPSTTKRLRTVDYIETGWVEVTGSWNEYWSSRSKSLQQNMRTQRSKLAGQGVKTSLEIITEADHVANAIEDFGRLESSGWKSSQGTAVRSDNEQGTFYRSVLQDFCEAGTGRIYRYRFDNQVVAVDLCIESPTVQVLLKTTYDESIKSLSPSSLLRQEAYRQIFEEGRIKRIEFYGRFMEWTKRWTDCKRMLYHINAYRWGIVPAAASRLSELRGALQRRRAVSN